MRHRPIISASYGRCLHFVGHALRRNTTVAQGSDDGAIFPQASQPTTTLSTTRTTTTCLRSTCEYVNVEKHPTKFRCSVSAAHSLIHSATHSLGTLLFLRVNVIAIMIFAICFELGILSPLFVLELTYLANEAIVTRSPTHWPLFSLTWCGFAGGKARMW